MPSGLEKDRVDFCGFLWWAFCSLGLGGFGEVVLVRVLVDVWGSGFGLDVWGSGSGVDVWGGCFGEDVWGSVVLGFAVPSRVSWIEFEGIPARRLLIRYTRIGVCGFHGGPPFGMGGKSRGRRQTSPDICLSTNQILVGIQTKALQIDMICSPTGKLDRPPRVL